MKSRSRPRATIGMHKPGITRSIWTAARLWPFHFMKIGSSRSSGWPARHTDRDTSRSDSSFSQFSLCRYGRCTNQRHKGNGAFMPKTVVGFFDTYDEAQGAYDELVRRRFEPSQITLITNRQTYRGCDAVGESPTSEPTAAAVGAATGAIVGGSAGLITSLIPGVGPVLAIGPLLATLFGAGMGAVAGGIIGT